MASVRTRATRSKDSSIGDPISAKLAADLAATGSRGSRPGRSVRAGFSAAQPGLFVALIALDFAVAEGDDRPG